jgi:hypothetical protein
MAKQTSGSRTPRSDASLPRLTALRASGWRGPVDQDGNKVTDMGEWICQQMRQAGGTTR